MNKAIKDAHCSSKSVEWSTPQKFFDKYDAKYGFTLDVCANSENAKCLIYFGIKVNGLNQKWGKNICWMNPPYGLTIIQWMRKAYVSSLQGAIVVCLVPARTDTKWWHCYAMKGQIEFIRGRLKFGNHSSPALFPSAVVVFSPPVNDAR